ncbi:hypothetical protein J437_LFUL003002 [Ladona fulva]|uniref:Uncharacterized protein n=1 Tax=Ladona fulva TaxID=123851 RepID=A0A8K0NUQ8_LADFU|nr:hypothetical protein J437_LFUL003002 [Ladona fulva]
MDIEEIAALEYLDLAKKIKKNRRFWIHSILLDETATSLFYTIYPRIKEDEAKFFNFCRMSLATFDELLGVLRNSLTRQDTTMRAAVTPEEKLVCTLR